MDEFDSDVQTMFRNFEQWNEPESTNGEVYHCLPFKLSITKIIDYELILKLLLHYLRSFVCI